jgi:integrase
MLAFLRNLRRNAAFEEPHRVTPSRWYPVVLPASGFGTSCRPHFRTRRLLGLHGSDESHAEYTRLLAEWRTLRIEQQVISASQVAAMIQLQRMTGMRPCKVVMIRTGDIDRSKEVWIYTPSSHKNSWRGNDRKIPFGPKALELIKPFLKVDPEAHLFSPLEAEAHRNMVRRSLRQTPMTPSQRGRVPKAKPKRAKRDQYDVSSYRRAIKYAIRRANRERAQDGLEAIPNWFPLRLRHSRATELNELFGIEAAAVSLGQRRCRFTRRGCCTCTPDRIKPGGPVSDHG